jgi:Uma2 family endonuclease
MSESYEEIFEGETLRRNPPGARHEEICVRLHERISNCVQRLSSTRLLDARTVVQLGPGTLLRPDLALVTAATGKAWLIAEIIDSDDHRTDTVIKKQLYEELNLPRVWMIDPRYDNVEVYHGSQYGLSLNRILAHRDTLTEKLLPDLKLTVADLFGLSTKGVFSK